MGDPQSWLQWLASPAVIGLIIGWFNRRRIGSWFAAQKNLATCQSELRDVQASLDRTRADAAADRTMRDQERAYLQAAISTLTEQGERVAAARREGRLVTSESLRNERLPSPANSPTSPPKRKHPIPSRSRAPIANRSGHGQKREHSHEAH